MTDAARFVLLALIIAGLMYVIYSYMEWNSSQWDQIRIMKSSKNMTLVADAVDTVWDPLQIGVGLPVLPEYIGDAYKPAKFMTIYYYEVFDATYLASLSG